MLEKIREGSQSLVSRVILSVIILSFALTGISSYLYTEQDISVADVNGSEIKLSAVNRAYQSQLAQLKSSYGELFDLISEDELYKSKIKNDVLKSLIERELLQQYIQDLGLRASESEIAQMIIKMPEFMTDNQFNKERYLNLLRQVGLTNSSFEKSLGQDLARQQLLTGLSQSNFQVDTDFWAIHRLLHQERVFKYGTVLAKDFESKVQLTEAQIKAYYDRHLEDFTSPEKIQVQYIDLDIAKLKDKIQVSDTQISAHYNENKASFIEPEQRLPAHIFILKDSDKSIKELYAKLNSGVSFSELVKTYSEDPASVNKQGQLEWVKSGVMPEAFDKALFALKKGQTSEIVETETGFHIIQLIDIQEQKQIELARVESIVIDQIKQQQASDLFFEARQKLTDSSYESPEDLTAAAQTTGLQIEQTAMFNQDKAPEALNHSVVKKALSSKEVLTERLNSELLEIEQDHVMVVRVKDYAPAQILELKTVEQEIKQTLIAEYSKTRAKELAQKVRTELEAGKESSISFKTLSLSRQKPSTEVSQELVQKVFKLPQPDDNAKSIDVLETNSGYQVVQLESVKQHDVLTEDFIESYQNQIESRLNQVEWMTLITLLRSQADMTVEKEKLDKL